MIKLEGKKIQHNHWAGVWSLALGISAIMIAEFLPSGLLTVMAKDMKISEALTGQTVTVTSLTAVFSSLSLLSLAGNHDRKYVLIFLIFLTTLSCLIAGYSHSFEMLLFGRVLLGISLGGFWSLAAALTIRLVETSKVTSALSVIFGAASFSGMLAAPLGSYLGTLMDWRTIFLINSLIGLVSLIALSFSLPNLKRIDSVKTNSFKEVLKIPGVRIGMIAIGFVFCGRFASTTYMRPYLENTVGLSGVSLSIMFFIFDISYFLGAIYAGKVVHKNLRNSLFIPPIVLALTSVGLISFSSFLPLVVFFLFLRGISFAPIPVSWSRWGTLIAPENNETIGVLYVASVQVSAALGGFLGGVAFDWNGPVAVFSLSSFVWLISSLLVFIFLTNKFCNKESAHV